MATVALFCGAACSQTAVRRPNVPVSTKAQEFRHAAGDGANDCGEAIEPKTGAACDVHPVGECLAAALGACRPAYGSRSFFTSESDAIRIDWIVVPDANGTCRLVTVEDRSADPLAPRTPIVKSCKALGWKPHETIASCEVPSPDKCDGAASRP